MSTPDQLLGARLSGVAGFCVENRVPREEAIRQLHEVSSRPDLLGIEAGREWAARDVDPVWYPWAAAKLELLVAAGADREVAEWSRAEALPVLGLGSHAIAVQPRGTGEGWTAETPPPSRS